MRDVRLAEVRVAIVTWNSADVIEPCLDSLRANGIDGTQVTVVDHGSGDDTLLRVERQMPGARRIVRPENRSYGAAINSAFADAGGRWLLILNPDTALRSGSLQRMVETLSDHPEAAAIVPSVFDLEGVNRTRIRRTSMLRALVFLARHRWSGGDAPGPFETWIAGRHQQWTIRSVPAAGLVRIPFAEGCCLLISREAFDLVGGFDEDYTFFYEDADLSLRFRTHGYLLLWDPSSSVVHVGGHAFSRMPDERLSRMLQGMLLFYSKHAYRRYVWWRRVLRTLARCGAASSHPRGREWWRALDRDLREEAYLPDGRRSPRPVEAGLVSIIIPTHRRPQLLRRLLEALARQTYRACEVIIVDQSPVVFDDVPPELKFPATILHVGVANRSLAKNVGARVARGEWLLFVDDDILPSDDLVAAHVEAFRQRPVAGVSCRVVEGATDKGVRRRKQRITSYGRIVTGFDARGSEHIGMLVGGNMSLRAERFRQTTGFDGSLVGTSILEEPEICEQIAHRGGVFWFSDASVARHDPQPGGNEDLRRLDGSRYYWSVHRNLTLLFLRHRSRWQLPGLVVWCVLRSVRQSLLLGTGVKGALRMLEGVWGGALRYYRALE
jgi:GT2 family glycosyltransferase